MLWPRLTPQVHHPVRPAGPHAGRDPGGPGPGDQEPAGVRHQDQRRDPPLSRRTPTPGPRSDGDATERTRRWSAGPGHFGFVPHPRLRRGDPWEEGVFLDSGLKARGVACACACVGVCVCVWWWDVDVTELLVKDEECLVIITTPFLLTLEKSLTLNDAPWPVDQSLTWWPTSVMLHSLHLRPSLLKENQTGCFALMAPQRLDTC